MKILFFKCRENVIDKVTYVEQKIIEYNTPDVLYGAVYLT